MAIQFFRCKHCGNIIVKCVDSGVSVVCCGEEMEELIPNTTDAAQEKHVPVVERMEEGNLHVKVGSAPHPTTKEHHIVFLYIETERGGIFHRLSPTEPAEADFCVGKGKVLGVYAYCNLHGLWIAKV